MPYVPPKPRHQATPVESPVKNLEMPSSSITPAFTGSSFEPATMPELYSPKYTANPPVPTVAEAEAIKPTPLAPALPDTSDMVSQASLSRASTASVNPSVVSKRSSWSHRKPVPSNITIPSNSIPSSHPFARGASSPRTQLDVGLPPVSPRLSGPVPPRRAGVHNRSISNLASPASPAPSDLSEGSGMFWRPPVPETRDTEDADEKVEVLKSLDSESSDRGAKATTGDSRQPTTLSPRRSSGHSTQIATPQLGDPITHSPRATTTVSTHETQESTPRVVSAQHPLRLRLDKSLPALPLNVDDKSIHRGRESRHKATNSTDSGPSTQIATPRSNSQALASGRGSEEEAVRRKTTVKLPKALRKMPWNKKEKASADHLAAGAVDTTLAQDDDEEVEVFSVDQIPSKRRLLEAGTLFLRDENGDLVCFGDMFPSDPPSFEEGQPTPPIPRTVVFFIRHFWCGQCQDFMFASLSQLDPVAVEKAGIRVIVISNGSWKIIKSYKKLFKCPFPIYVDGPRKLYQLMGMTKMTNDFGPLYKGRAAYHQRSVPKQLFHGSKNAITKMPLAYPGKLTQLGGEFVLSPGYNCDFAHRMTNTSNHMEAPDVLREAGCLYPTKAEIEEITIAENQRAEFERLEKEMQIWRTQRETELDRMRRRKAERRGEEYIPMTNRSMAALGLDDQSDREGGSEVSHETGAQAAVSLPIDAPRPGDADGLSTMVADDGPMCLPVGSANDVLTWEDEEDSITTPRLEERFEKSDKSEDAAAVAGTPADVKSRSDMGHHDIQLSKGRDFADATFGRKASGTGSGLEVRIVN